MASTETERRLHASIAAHSSWAATSDRTRRTAPAREALEAKFLAEAGGDPQRAESLKKGLPRAPLPQVGAVPPARPRGDRRCGSSGSRARRAGGRCGVSQSQKSRPGAANDGAAQSSGSDDTISLGDALAWLDDLNHALAVRVALDVHADGRWRTRLYRSVGPAERAIARATERGVAYQVSLVRLVPVGIVTVGGGRG